MFQNVKHMNAREFPKVQKRKNSKNSEFPKIKEMAILLKNDSMFLIIL